MNKRVCLLLFVLFLSFGAVVCCLTAKLQQLEMELEEFRNPGWNVAEDTISPNATSPHGDGQP